MSTHICIPAVTKQMSELSAYCIEKIYNISGFELPMKVDVELTNHPYKRFKNSSIEHAEVACNFDIHNRQCPTPDAINIDIGYGCTLSWIAKGIEI